MKTSTRIKAGSIATREEFEKIVNEIAITSVEIRRKEAARDAALQRLRETWAPGLSQLTDRLTLLTLAAEKYATEHGAELLPGKEKSAETSLARWGFRTGMPTLKLLTKWTWLKVLDAIATQHLAQFIRLPEPEVNKQALITAAAEGSVALGELGCKLVQSEAFFVEPKEQEGAV